ncbi:MAG TPA: DUF2865 domain-containing protein [Xanthobacteraceae bacterium]|jgi:hypothetical protein
MPLVSRRQGRPFAIAGLALSMVLLVVSQASAGFLDSLFSDRQQDTRAPLPYADTSAAPPVNVTPREPGYGSGVTFCVRLCDGRFFPLQRHAGATPIQACGALCPAAKTKIFSGSEISHASASDGARYPDLANAFVYRKTIVPDCTCNGRDAFGLAPVDVANDPTLRPGDLVATADGLQKFSGAQANQRKGGGSSPAKAGEADGERHRMATTGVAAAN